MVNSERAEFNLIKVIVENPDCFNTISAQVSPEDFKSKNYSDLYCFCLDKSVKGEAFTPDIIISTGNAEWTKIVCEVPSIMPLAANAQAYVDEVLQASQLRKLQQAAQELSKQEDYTKAAEIAKEIHTLAQGEKNTSSILPKKYSIASFMQEVKDRAGRMEIPTGFNILDDVLGGGLYPGLFTIGGMSSAGKTTLVLQLACNLAEKGEDVIFFTLEQDVFELQGKCLSRLTYEISGGDEKGEASTAREITSGNKYKSFGEGKKRLIQKAIKKYSAEIEPRLYFVEGSADTNINIITKIAKQHYNQTSRVPIIIIDYLQIIPATSDRLTDKQNADQSVSALRRLARDLKTPVIVLSSLNRTSYNDEIQLASFKESGGIEYSSDVTIGLELGGCERDKKGKIIDLDVVLRAPVRDINLKFLKNRNGEKDKVIKFSFRPKFSYYEETVTSNKTEEEAFNNPA